MIALLVAGEVKPRLMPKMTGPNAATATFANLQWHSIEDGLVKKRLYYQDVYPILSNRKEWIALTRGPVSIVFELDYKKGCRRLSRDYHLLRSGSALFPIQKTTSDVYFWGVRKNGFPAPASVYKFFDKLFYKSKLSEKFSRCARPSHQENNKKRNEKR